MKYLYIIALSLSFISCNSDDDIAILESEVFIYTIDPNKEQYEGDMSDYQYLYLAHTSDKSCETLADWTTYNYTSNGPLSYEHYLIYYFLPPYSIGYGSKPDYKIFSNNIYDIEVDSTEISCNNNIGESLLITNMSTLIENGDLIINLN